MYSGDGNDQNSGRPGKWWFPSTRGKAAKFSIDWPSVLCREVDIMLNSVMAPARRAATFNKSYLSLSLSNASWLEKHNLECHLSLFVEPDKTSTSLQGLHALNQHYTMKILPLLGTGLLPHRHRQQAWHSSKNLWVITMTHMKVIAQILFCRHQGWPTKARMKQGLSVLVMAFLSSLPFQEEEL